MQTRREWSRARAVGLVLGLVGCGGMEQAGAGSSASVSPTASPRRAVHSSKLVRNRFGFSRTMTANGGPLNDEDSPFFQSLGQNGRSCSTCHVPEAGMTITPELVRERFAGTDGLDPLFR